jgi:transposase
MLKVPQELGVGPGTTCWRRLKRWIDAGVFAQLHQILLKRLNTGNRIDWSRAAMDGNHIDAKRGSRDRPVAGQPRKPGSQTPSDL